MARSKRLATYRAKRDFGVTPEPDDAALAAPARGRARYVIQKHAARRLHYDLRLEIDGVFKSWALTRGPSLDPHAKRLAVETEDHPLAYGDFEGSIPRGEYGGGTVQVWDRGYWQPLTAGSAARDVASGKLDLVLAGERLNGGWTLVRMQSRKQKAGHPAWLFIKRQDDYARVGADEALLANDHSVASGRSLAAIARGVKRPARPFMTTDSPPTKSPPERSPRRRRARPAAAATLPEFVPLQLCRLVERPPGGAGWVHEIKFDGYRMQLRVVAGEASLRTRSGLDWSARFPQLVERAATLGDCVLDGEVVALDDAGMSDFAALQAALSTGRTEALVYFAFDLLFEGGRDLRPLPLLARKEALETLLGRARRNDVLRYVEHFTTAGDAVLQSACRMALEGIVSKRTDAPYSPGRGGSWTKAKCRAGQEVVIGGWATTDGRFRSLLVGVQRDGELVYAGRVGTGFGARALATLEPRLRAVERARSPFSDKGAPASAPGVHWVRPTLVAEIEFAGWTGDGQVRQAAYKGLREDKPPQAVREERAASAPAAKSTPVARRTRGTSSARADEVPRAARQERAAVLGVTLSHADKTLWPAHDGAAVDKLALARYYERIAPRLLPHLAGRPCSIVRAPDGIDGEHFFQRHAMRGNSNLIDLVTVASDRKPYLEINRAAGLIALAQLGALELHPWNNLPGDPETPGRLVFDLDPAPDVPFTAVVTAAHEVAERLRALGLTPFCKTTGGKGLHVVTPLARSRGTPLDWATAKQFCRALCLAMAADSPERYVVNMSKRKRTGRIFLDYLRNDRMATAVAPWSPRARPGAPISMPLAWRNVTASLDPAAFTVHSVSTVPRDPWRGYAEAAADLRATLRRAS